MDDADVVVAVAADLVRRHGQDALSHIRDQAEIAAGLGDDVSLNAWTDIAEAAATLMDRNAVVTMRPRQAGGAEGPDKDRA